MALTPLEIQKTRFAQRMRGYDPQEVESFLSFVAEEMTHLLAEIERLERENRFNRKRLEEGESREHQLQQTLLRAQKVSDEITDAAKREAKLVVREAEMAADKLVQQALERASALEQKIEDLRVARRELQLKFRNTLDLFRRILDEDTEEERSTAVVHTLTRKSGA